MKIKCPVCSSDSFLFYPKKEIFKCPECSHIFANLRLDNNKIEDLYGYDYFHGAEYTDYTDDEKWIKRNLNKRLHKTLQFVENPQNSRLFEVGSAYGFFLELAEKHFKTAVGIDISPVCKNSSNIFQGKLEEHHFESNYDVFCLWDTIEHLVNPGLYLEIISKNIEKNGILAISTGDIGSLNAKINGKNWRQIHPPSHLHYFSVKSMSKLLEMKDFEVVEISHPGQWISFKNLFESLFARKYNLPLFYKALMKSPFKNCGFFVNFFDLMVIIARKKR